MYEWMCLFDWVNTLNRRWFSALLAHPLHSLFPHTPLPFILYYLPSLSCAFLNSSSLPWVNVLNLNYYLYVVSFHRLASSSWLLRRSCSLFVGWLVNALLSLKLVVSTYLLTLSPDWVLVWARNRSYYTRLADSPLQTPPSSSLISLFG